MKKVYDVIEVELEEDTIDKLAAFGLEQIAKDKHALVEYAAVKILERVIEHPEEFKELAEKYRAEHPDEICPKCDFLMERKNVADNGGKCMILVCPNCNYEPETHG